MTNNNKENNKEITTTTITHSLTEGKAREEKAERLLPYGNEHLVRMTLGQFMDLAHRLGIENLRRYIRKMEVMIINGGDFFKSHYKTILRWAREDAELEK